METIFFTQYHKWAFPIRSTFHAYFIALPTTAIMIIQITHKENWNGSNKEPLFFSLKTFYFALILTVASHAWAKAQ
jgi:hypothetical protein